MDDLENKSVEEIVQEKTAFPYVCFSCKEENLTEDVHLASCQKCGSVYCVHHASSVDPMYCRDCLKDVTMTEQIITKTSEHYDEKRDKVISKKQRARQISFGGLDFLFASRKLEHLSDEELMLAIEYHRAIHNAMLYEREKRRIEHFHRNVGKEFKIPTSGGLVSTETTTVKKTRTLKPKQASSQDIDLKTIITQLLKAGMTHEQIMAHLAKGKK